MSASCTFGMHGFRSLMLLILDIIKYMRKCVGSSSTRLVTTCLCIFLYLTKNEENYTKDQIMSTGHFIQFNSSYDLLALIMTTMCPVRGHIHVSVLHFQVLVL